jgi:hypothetical protein
MLEEKGMLISDWSRGAAPGLAGALDAHMWAEDAWAELLRGRIASEATAYASESAAALREGDANFWAGVKDFFDKVGAKSADVVSKTFPAFAKKAEDASRRSAMKKKLATLRHYGVRGSVVVKGFDYFRGAPPESLRPVGASVGAAAAPRGPDAVKAAIMSAMSIKVPNPSTMGSPETTMFSHWRGNAQPGQDVSLTIEYPNWFSGAVEKHINGYGDKVKAAEGVARAAQAAAAEGSAAAARHASAALPPGTQPDPAAMAIANAQKEVVLLGTMAARSLAKALADYDDFISKALDECIRDARDRMSAKSGGANKPLPAEQQ